MTATAPPRPASGRSGLEQKGDRAGSDQHRDGKDDADRLQRADDGQRQDRQQAVVQQPHRQADRSRMLRIEGMQQQIAPPEDR